MSRHLSEDDLSDLFADERRALVVEYEGEIAELRAEVDDLREQVKTLSPLRPVADVIHAELLRSDTVEYVPEVPGHSPAMLRVGRMVVSGMSAGPLLEALRGFCLDFTNDKE